MFSFVERYLTLNPDSSEDAAIVAAGDEFNLSRSSVQRHIDGLEHSVRNKIAAREAVAFDLAPIRRLAAFYSRGELKQLGTLQRPLLLRLVEVHEELEALRAVKKRRARRKAAR